MDAWMHRFDFGRNLCRENMMMLSVSLKR